MAAISVIIPVFNSIDFIQLCLDSLGGQTIASQVELVFIDDCSSDGSSEYIKNYFSKKPYAGELRIIRHEQNRGAAIARLTGLIESTGEYIMFCDSDDWIAEDMCEKMLKCAIDNNYDMVVCGFHSISSSSSYDYAPQCKDNFLKGLLLCRDSGSLCNKIVKRNIIVNDNMIYPSLSFCEDFAYSVQLSIYAKSIGFLDTPLYYYCHRENSIVTTKGHKAVLKRFYENMENYKIVKTVLEKCQLEDVYKEEIIALKLTIRNSLRDYCSDKEILSRWRSTFPELSKEIFQSRFISLRSKIAYFLTYIGLYTTLRRFF